MKALNTCASHLKVCSSLGMGCCVFVSFKATAEKPSKRGRDEKRIQNFGLKT